MSHYQSVDFDGHNVSEVVCNKPDVIIHNANRTAFVVEPVWPFYWYHEVVCNKLDIVNDKAK